MFKKKSLTLEIRKRQRITIVCNSEFLVVYYQSLSLRRLYAFMLNFCQKKLKLKKNQKNNEVKTLI